jgi:hypothetical protein
MSIKRLALVIVVLLVFGVALAVVLKHANISVAPPGGSVSTAPVIPAPTVPHPAVASKILVQHTSINGTQSYSGTVLVPPCVLLTSYPHMVTNHLTLILNFVTPRTTCAATVASSTQSFKVSIGATTAPVLDGVMLGGSPVAYSLVEGN